VPSCRSPASYHRSQCPSPCQSMYNLSWTKCHFSPLLSLSLLTLQCSTLIFAHHKRHLVVSWVTRLRTGQSGVRFLTGKRDFSSNRTCRPTNSLKSDVDVKLYNVVVLSGQLVYGTAVVRICFLKVQWLLCVPPV